METLKRYKLKCLINSYFTYIFIKSLETMFKSEIIYTELVNNVDWHIMDKCSCSTHLYTKILKYIGSYKTNYKRRFIFCVGK